MDFQSLIIYLYFGLMSLLPVVLSTTKLAKLMVSLDRNITEILTHPTRDQGEQLLNTLDEYVIYYRDINNLLDLNPKFIYKTAKYLSEIGAPQFLQEEVDFKNLHIVFEWAYLKTEVVRQYIEELRNLTKTFKVNFSKLSDHEHGKYDYESTE